MKIKNAFGGDFNLEQSTKEDKDNDEEIEENTDSLEERRKKEFEEKFVENMKNEEDNKDSFENLDNVFSRNILKTNKPSEKKMKIEKDDLLGWDL
jgi:hypothetical protein